MKERGAAPSVPDREPEPAVADPERDPARYIARMLTKLDAQDRATINMLLRWRAPSLEAIQTSEDVSASEQPGDRPEPERA